MKKISVAVDGPAGAGKSSVSKAVAEKYGFVYVDTGAMYRAIAKKCIDSCITSPDEVVSILDSTDVFIKYLNGIQHVFLDGIDVTDSIRTQEVSSVASDISAIADVRLKLVELQRKMATENNVIMDGRDIGTYVLSNADVKIFLTASSEERAKRRCLEYQQNNISFDFDKVKKDIETRDYNDSHREFAPLKKAADAILINTDGMSFINVVDTISKIIEEKL